MATLLAPKFIFLYCLLLSTVYIHYRGKVRYGVFRQLSDHSTFFSPINAIMYMCSKVENKPYLKLDQFPELQVLRDNWELIRDEALALNEAKHIKASDKLDDVGFNSFFRTGWKRFYLTWYDDYLPSAKLHCPKTVELLEAIPSVKGAMFASLPPDGKLVRHRDPYAGSMRYHLGLSTPNAEDCYISVDGINYSWRDGEDVMFDETYIHYAFNNTDQNRIILFCDVERPLNNPIARWFNYWFGRIVVTASATKNEDTDKVGFLNRIFGTVYQVRILGKKIKKKNKNIYYLLKYLLFASILYAIFS